VIGAADSAATAFAENNVIIGKCRQPPPDSDRFRLDAEGNRRLSAFTSNSASAAAQVSFRTVGQTIGHYAQLFGDFSGDTPPTAIYLGSAHPALDACPQSKAITAECSETSRRAAGVRTGLCRRRQRRDRAATGTERPASRRSARGDTRSPTRQGEGGPSLLFVSFPGSQAYKPSWGRPFLFSSRGRREG
jgi:hypothetical protein